MLVVNLEKGEDGNGGIEVEEDGEEEMRSFFITAAMGSSPELGHGR